jgi:hypothetical protein
MKPARFGIANSTSHWLTDVSHSITAPHTIFPARAKATGPTTTVPTQMPQRIFEFYSIPINNLIVATNGVDASRLTSARRVTSAIGERADTRSRPGLWTTSFEVDRRSQEQVENQRGPHIRHRNAQQSPIVDAGRAIMSDSSRRSTISL